MTLEIKKYPRTLHLQGSKLQNDDENNFISFNEIKDYELVIEEKLDGSNCGFRFDSSGTLLAQSRGHYLNLDNKGGREKHFNYFKDWLKMHENVFLNIFEDRYIVYGEWMYALHSIFYDNLNDYFYEFDIYDLKDNRYLTTHERNILTKNLPIKSVPVLERRKFKNINDILSLITISNYKTENWKENLKKSCDFVNDNYEKRLLAIDNSNLMEGLYIKVETNDVINRCKYVRNSFKQIVDNSSHWHEKIHVPNMINQYKFDIY